jgi:hypothetical protein
VVAVLAGETNALLAFGDRRFKPGGGLAAERSHVPFGLDE